MQLVTYAQSIHDLNLIKANELNEVIISDKQLGRIAKNESFVSLANMAKELGLKVVLEWDVILTENEFASACDYFSSIPHDSYDVIRVQDVGVLAYVLENTNKPIQFIAETGNRNLTGLKKWVNLIGERLDRLVLSVELSKDKIKEISSQLNCTTELLVCGPLLLFYSPRKLLSAMLDESEKIKMQQIQQQFLTASGESQESPHKGFPIIQNQHGTFMYHIKDLFLFDKYQELLESGISFARIDLRAQEDISYLSKLVDTISNSQDFATLKQAYPRDVIRGYFHINKTDVLFKKLKNYRIQRKDDAYIGEVMEIVKGEYVAIKIKSHEVSLNLGDQVKFVTPEGKELLCKVHELKDTAYKEVTSKSKGELALMNYMGGVWPKSQVYRG